MNAIAEPEVSIAVMESGDIDVLCRYYSKQLLRSERARQSFVLPDRATS